MPTLLLSPRILEDTSRLREAALAAGWEVVRLQRWRPEGEATPPVAIYGEPLFVLAVAEALGVALVEPPLDWLARLPERYRRRAVECLTLGEARAVPGPRFIKPADDKCFPAQVYPGGGAELPRYPGVDEATLTLVAEPVLWELEVRLFVVDRAIKAASIYARDGGQIARAEDGSWPWSDAERAEALAFAGGLLADPAVELPRAVVLDVGRIAGRGWAAVELNPAFGSGLYGCDAAGALAVIAAACGVEVS
ncbi:MAG: ATP-grasp domain-containing protein [Myxococcales bacterium]|nr:ATP-grasp domain-containing protein [Myxococcales bacterium]MCB9705694.1 ATP-grasp domain-containing protein [Myxococcales bacterium]